MKIPFSTMPKSDPLEAYRLKRNFDVTPEPAEGGKSETTKLSFVVQKHWATRLHYDFRLEFQGTLRSWAVPKGPSLDPKVKRMAVQVEDHPLAYGGFEGTIPPRQYGAGKVIVWDRGSWTPIEDAEQGFRAGKLKFELHGEKLRGRWALVRMRGDDDKSPPWLLIKENDHEVRPQADYDVTEALPDSVLGKADRRETADPTAGSQAPETGKKKPARPPSPRREAAPVVTRATAPAFPKAMDPQLATLVESAPEQGQWLYELKFDGYRLMACLDGDEVACMTRNGHDWTEKMPQLADSLRAMQLKKTWLDGEIIVPGSDGIPDFQLLQNAFEGRGRRVAAGRPAASPNSAAIVYYVFDIPFLDGQDLRHVPLIERRALLQALLKGNDAPNLRFSDAFDAPSDRLVLSACKLGFEGLIGKLADAPYRSGRSADWIKLKCGRRQEFVIGGFTDPKGTRTGIGALLLGLHDDSGKLIYAGNVGSGFNEEALTDLRERLTRLEIASHPFDSKPVMAGKPHWVRPELLAEISFADWTHANLVRHAVFRGLRTDKAPNAITREKAVKASDIENASGKSAATTKPEASSPSARAAPKKAAAGSVKPQARREPKVGAKPTGVSAPLPTSLRITHADRVIDTSTGITKLELVQHYALVAPLMIPHIENRPVSLVRAPSGVAGELFFQKHAKDGELQGVNLLDPALDPDHASLLEISTATGLLSAAQMNTVEFHTWNALQSAIDKPDRMTFDLDPGEGLDWPRMQEAAALVRTMLEELGCVPFLKTSGGKGLHVVVPIRKQHGWDAVKDFSHHIVDHLAKTLPQLFVSKSGPANRIGKIFVDYLRNGFGATTASAWTARARPGMGVSVPVDWDELSHLTSGAHWTLRNISERLETGNSPWKAYAKSARPLGKAMKVLGYNAQD